MNTEKLAQKIEAILFFKGEPVTIDKLLSILKVSREELAEAIISLNSKLADRGIVLMEKENELALGTNPEFSDLISDLQKEELNKELSKSSLETLSIVLYKNGASRADIDYIRGVNSSFILRALVIRGLVEKIVDKKDSRRYIYKPSFELLSYLGVKSVEELPNYGELNISLEDAAKNIEDELKEEENIEKSSEDKQEEEKEEENLEENIISGGEENLDSELVEQVLEDIEKEIENGETE
ncbi:MAG TPA: SMC-Scp complex subunit ScpB [Candidatus Paceibacterota bacterium]|nr:SMC-Scp complex subunit ScpB [Candidatus Paceibacterota bacterium]